MSSLRWITLSMLTLTATPALANTAMPWGHSDTPYADEVAAQAASASARTRLDLAASDDAPWSQTSGFVTDYVSDPVPDPFDDAGYGIAAIAPASAPTTLGWHSDVAADLSAG